jgi:hypothetical protein
VHLLISKLIQSLNKSDQNLIRADLRWRAERDGQHE